MAKPKKAPTRKKAAAAAKTSEPATVAGADADFPGSGYRPVYGRIPIVELRPQLDDNLFPTRSFEGDVVPFSCVSFREGHDRIGVELVLTQADGQSTRQRMLPGAPGSDSWQTHAQLTAVGTAEWRIEAWSDDYGTWRHNAEIKIAAGVDVDVMLELGARVLERGALNPELSKPQAAILVDAAAAARFQSRSASFRLASLTADDVLGVLAMHPVRSLVTRSETRRILVERKLAGVGAWYELFPRSEGAVRHEDGTWTSGTLRTAAERLPGVKAMGFDVLYIPPIHPIGTTNRKGKNNTLTTEPGDPGSPYAIGAAEGGHKAIHPELGTFEDFDYFVSEVRRNGMELAIDIALQASPDHPWVTEHPEWFTQLPDGTIAYAENPPKKYQDIYPLQFDDDRAGAYTEMLETIKLWISHGVTLFRVDNPHTKPLQFWEWLIHEVHLEHPEIVFLSEAFTRPAMMRALAKAGFTQSYTYFTWRNTKEELESYLTEVSHETSDYLRPNFFVNTHDILTPYLQHGGRPAYVIRAALAAFGSPTWGVYAGYELIENVARPGSEENIDNEKYEFKHRDWAAEEASGHSLAPYIAQLNAIRHAHPALQQLRNFELQYTASDRVIAFSKHIEARYSSTGQDDTIIVVVSLDPHETIETQVFIDQTKFGLPQGSEFTVEELLTGSVWTWGGANYVRFDPHELPVHVLHVRRDGDAPAHR